MTQDTMTEPTDEAKIAMNMQPEESDAVLVALLIGAGDAGLPEDDLESAFAEMEARVLEANVTRGMMGALQNGNAMLEVEDGELLLRLATEDETTRSLILQRTLANSRARDQAAEMAASAERGAQAVADGKMPGPLTSPGVSE